MKACYAEQMRRTDRRASEEAGIPSIVLMENAAFACVEELKKVDRLREKKVLILCGKGNNGGDGFAIARQLHMIGVSVKAVPICGTALVGDARINYCAAEYLGLVHDDMNAYELELELKYSDIIVDAIYGTGIHGTLTGYGAEVIDMVNQCAKYVLSVDIPSGINADTGEICGVCVRADKTVTFAAWKIGMLMYPGAEYIGEVVVAPISIPKDIVNDDEFINVIDGEFEKYIPKRRADSQKGDYGKIFIIAGSRGMSGAAYMAAQSALYSGAGLVTLGICESISEAMEIKTTEVMTVPLADSNGHIAYAAEPEILLRLEKCDCVLIGPGLGRSREAQRIVKTVLAQSRVPVVLDADALYAAAQDLSMISECSCPIILTPHEMEMARLTGKDVEEIRANRLGVSREFCEKYGVTLILKGSRTIVTSPDLTQYINITGNPGMATGGSGDVLAGMTAALASRTDEVTAAALAVRMHGKAGDMAAAKYGMDGMSAADIMECLREPNITGGLMR